MSKSMLIISRQAPWAGPAAREALDIALAGGAFDLPLAMLFLDDGVFQLLADQQPGTLQQTDLAVEELYVSGRSLSERGLGEAQLALPAQALDDAALTLLLDRFDHLVTI